MMLITVILGAVLPLLAAKQRHTAANDWMSTDAEIACPDPNCKSRLRIVRTGLRTFKHSEVTAVPLDPAPVKDGEKFHGPCFQYYRRSEWVSGELGLFGGHIGGPGAEGDWLCCKTIGHVHDL
ncbi:hypothetical protein CC1G_15503 [Coprinopsis cinerea okayama7|uniref:Secreted protein n=1 Tax=Coprinopsis cinerea (strain Okayama-7 / 130 / ATCC MYA-4618 / FGSC 9003) TaxID=240176 RepID=D6RN47_COPC7|nr:hypothetical protein CC1G_15503 [Coprinopsis cinerea okayama7\|eukprot:XP_002910962.1 hypothetical protein CC1G_15503 [Coprinopsis cinerea okayama7\